MSGFGELNAEELLQVMAQRPVLLVDVRTASEVLAGVLPNAVHIPLSHLPIEYEALIKVEYVVFYCQHGIRSAHAAAFLANKGGAQVHHLIGGVVTWVGAGHPLEPWTAHTH